MQLNPATLFRTAIRSKVFQSWQQSWHILVSFKASVQTWPVLDLILFIVTMAKWTRVEICPIKSMNNVIN